mmetsp:Transcript_17074/g.29957  ORF Transcript_17074/g.29957 Transcript_17074/m.29957 type:complete len:236 (+) Transcript_17074:210-917(+)
MRLLGSFFFGSLFLGSFHHGVLFLRLHFLLHLRLIGIFLFKETFVIPACQQCSLALLLLFFAFCVQLLLPFFSETFEKSLLFQFLSPLSLSYYLQFTLDRFINFAYPGCDQHRENLVVLGREELQQSSNLPLVSGTVCVLVNSIRELLPRILRHGSVHRHCHCGTTLTEEVNARHCAFAEARLERVGSTSPKRSGDDDRLIGGESAILLGDSPRQVKHDFFTIFHSWPTRQRCLL